MALIITLMTTLGAWACMEMVVLGTVIAGALGVAVWPAKTNAPALFAVTLLEPTFRTAAGAGIANVLPPIAMLDPPGRRTIGVLEIMMMEFGMSTE